MVWKILYLFYDLTCMRLIVEKFRPPPNDDPEKASREGKTVVRPPSSGLLWFVSAYIALFGLAYQRYEAVAIRIEVSANALVSQLGACNNDYEYKQVLSDIPRVQRLVCPERPELKDPCSIIKSLVGGRRKHKPTVSLLAAVIQTWKHKLGVLDQSSAQSSRSIAKLNRAILKQVDLSFTNLQRVSFVEADLPGADFFKADLSGSVFIGANLKGASLACSTLNETDFRWADLSDVNLISDRDACPPTGWPSTFMRNANICGIKGASAKFIEWAKNEGAVVYAPDEWKEYKKSHREEIENLVSNNK